ncbi:hypothetical protein HMPREF7215_1146 [Pyramidobacter piscolens W5455]|uniref:Uncharacterized protein n=1 Tax=Pyramidobacter piscolens W5455 TaxID=352165 RepID=A0ABM9ZVC7_9BACT|nr:hypothetical protein HMPREF7215_1146 [Pyramidobacter piscolens W5455]
MQHPLNESGATTIFTLIVSLPSEVFGSCKTIIKKFMSDYYVS